MSAFGLKYAAAAFMAAVLAVNAPLAAEESFSDAKRAEIEQIVHDYLVNHPEVMFEVAAKMEQLQQVKAAQTLSETVETLRTDAGTPKRGPENAGHYLIEFFDYNCGYCKVVREFTERLVDEHQLQGVYVEFPILSNESVQAAAVGLALYALNPQQYFVYQKTLMSKGSKIESFADIEAALKTAGADIEAVKTKAASQEVQDQLRFNLEQGRRLGVAGTPFFIIDGKVVRGAVRDYETLEQLLTENR